MKLKKALILCSILAAAVAIQTGASAATQVYTMPDISSESDTGDITALDENGHNSVTTILNGAETGPWTGVKTGTGKWRILPQSTYTKDGAQDKKIRFVDPAGSALKFDYANLANSGIKNTDIIYYTFNFMGAPDGTDSTANPGHFAFNNVQLNDSSLNLYNTDDRLMYKYYPEKIVIITDNLNKKTYYYTPGNSAITDTPSGYETAVMIGTRTLSSEKTRSFFNDFSSGKIEYEVNGANMVTAGGSEDYTIAETGASLGVDYTPANMTLALASSVDGVNIENRTLTVENTVANNTEVTINANINGTTVASKTVTISNPPAAEPTVSAEKLSSTKGDDGSVADVFYAAFNANGSSANKVNVTVNETTQSITTANMSGEGSVCFGIVISYADGNNKGYKPTFTFE